MKSIRIGVAVIGFVLAAVPASAGHGKPGTWESKVQPGGGALPNMANLPPAVQAQMKARGVQMTAGIITSRYCMTPEQVAQDKPVLTPRDNCETKNLKLTGNTFTADMICRGEMKTTGHIEVTFDSAEHYHGKIVNTMEMGGQSRTSTMLIEARWLSSNCVK